jgi:thiamine monophosphate synthase
VLALGGIVEPAQVRSAVAAGVRGVAVIRGVLSAADPVDAALRLLAAADPARSLSGKSRRRVRGSRGRIPVR